MEVLLDTVVRVRFDDDQDKKSDQATTAGSSKKQGNAAGCKVPVTGLVDANMNLYREILDGIEPCLSPPAAGDPPGVGFLSLNISWPPEHHLRRGRYCVAYIQSHHKSCFLLCVASCSPQLSGRHTSFHLVYDTLANSVSVVPRDTCYFRRDLASGIALLRCGGGEGDGDFVLAQLCIRKDSESQLPTNKGTLLTWRGSLLSGPPSGEWVEKEAVFPLPVDERTANGLPYCSFYSDTVFAVGSTGICWVDLVTGLLIYRIDEQKFHFIPLPKDCVTERGDMEPKHYRSMCCIQGRQGEILKLASLEGYGQADVRIAEVTLTTWTLLHPLLPDDWTWEKDESSYRMADLFNDPVYKDELKLQPLPPCFPVFSTVKTGVIYLSLIDVKFNYMQHMGDLRGVHVLSVDMDSHRVAVSAFSGPSDGNPEVIPFASNFSSYLNDQADTIFRSSEKKLQQKLVRWRIKQKKLQSYRLHFKLAEDWEEVADEGGLHEERPSRKEGDDLYECPSREEAAGKGKSRRNPGLIISTPCTVLRGGSSKLGLQCVLDSYFS